MKRLIWILVLASFLFCVLSQPARGADVCHWYTKRGEKGRPPLFGPEQTDTDRYGAVYLDKKADASGDKVIYLTFDVGYLNESVLSILDTLEKEEVPAAFFVLRHFVTESADIVTRMQKAGHLICNHTASHKDMSVCTKDELVEELKEMEQILLEKTGATMAPYFRPPAGVYRQELLETAKACGYRTVFWSLCYADWDNNKQPDPQKSIRLLESYLHPGAILLLHPTSKTNAEILPTLIRDWKEQGYRFASLDTLPQDP